MSAEGLWNVQPERVGPDELDEVVAFVAAQQARPERSITYVGTEAAGIRAELDGLAPPWATTARVVRAAAGVTGAVAVEWDGELGRAWILGPWVAGDDDAWSAGAGPLLDAALAQPPPAVTRYELCGDVAHRGLAALAAGRGWSPTEVNHVLVVDAATAGTWAPDDGGAGPLRPAGPDDTAGIAALHDVEFPDSYASARQLVDGQGDGSRTVLVADDGRGGVAGYAAGEVHDDGEGYVDFVVVAPAARGTGLGRRLMVGLTRRLLDRAPLDRVALTVQDHRRPARALYERLGFRSDGSIVAYRSWTPDQPA
jgi:ribosomal protein S18 acetylase RimI-like enzyme